MKDSFNTSPHKRRNEDNENLTPDFKFEEFGIGKEKLQNEGNKIIDEAKKASENKGNLIVRPANDWIELAKTQPIPKMLFDEFWFQGEICILFADANLGKSILAVQISNSISCGEAIPGFRMEALAQVVLYFDFELSQKQFENRYSNNFQNHHRFDDKLNRIEPNPNSKIPDRLSFEEYLNESLEQTVIDTGAKILVIDNLTYVRSDTENAKEASPLMKHLKSLKEKYGLSILILAHTPKRDLSKPITRNHLSGSKMLMNLIDSSFTIGESQIDKSIRYLKQIKVRFTEIRYDSENVCVCEIEKPDNFLRFRFQGFGCEREHLKEPTQSNRDELIEKTKELSAKGQSQREIARVLGIGVGTVNKYLKM